ncbi:MAG: hypothetical protein KGQ60_04380 [Planctomycetes bacterium]|nr:hypothetical protein [Planctomycetota bacterium]
MPRPVLSYSEARWQADANRQKPDGQMQENGISIHVENIREEEIGRYACGIDLIRPVRAYPSHGNIPSTVVKRLSIV